jgi:hypothetical protein
MRPPFPLLPGARAHTLPASEFNEVRFVRTPHGFDPGIYHDEAVEQMLAMCPEPSEEQLQRRQRLLAEMIAHPDRNPFMTAQREPTEGSRLLQQAFVEVSRMRGRMIAVSRGAKS